MSTPSTVARDPRTSPCSDTNGVTAATPGSPANAPYRAPDGNSPPVTRRSAPTANAARSRSLGASPAITVVVNAPTANANAINSTGAPCPARPRLTCHPLNGATSPRPRRANASNARPNGGNNRNSSNAAATVITTGAATSTGSNPTALDAGLNNPWYCRSCRYASTATAASTRSAPARCATTRRALRGGASRSPPSAVHTTGSSAAHPCSTNAVPATAHAAPPAATAAAPSTGNPNRSNTRNSGPAAHTPSTAAGTVHSAHSTAAAPTNRARPDPRANCNSSSARRKSAS
ncbi:hypothetical protein [Kitasatospora cineracea]|uniref:hypothetical protein n=1 Tax=Kitasatospora cineracea TaxID=88074 RepID=UPI0037B2D761